MHSFSHYKWKTWLLMAMAFVFSLFHRGALSVISPTLVDELHLSATAMSNIVSITYYTYALLQIPAGIALDSFGYRKVSSVGIAVAGFGSILIGAAQSMNMLLIARFLVGVGTSALFISALKAQRIWFSHQEFIKVSGYLSFLGCIGAIGSTFPLGMLTNLLGWRYTMFLIGAICIILGILIMTQLKDTPDQLGFPYVRPAQRSVKLPFLSILKHCLTHMATVRNFIILFTTVGATTALTGLWGIPYLMHQYRMGETHAAFYIAFVMYGLLSGSLLIHPIAIKFERNLMKLVRYALMAHFILWYVFLFVFHGKPPLFLLALFLFLLGFFATAHLLSFVDINEQLTTDDSGMASSIVNAGEFVGSTLLSIGIGWILDLTFFGVTISGVRMYETSQFLLAFRLFALTSLIGILATFIGSKPKNKPAK